MRAAIFEHLENGGAGLDPLARSAVEMLRAQYSQPPEAQAEAPLSDAKTGENGSDGHSKSLFGLWRRNVGS
jgi:hypothetical protein